MNVAIIGAGATGLCCARHLKSFPNEFAAVRVFEQSSHVGGTWVYSDRADTDKRDEHGLPLCSSMYRSLKTNLPIEIMKFPGFPFDPNLSNSFVSHEEVLRYLQEYAKHYKLYQYIQFHTLVEHVIPVVPPGTVTLTPLEKRSKGWRVMTRNLKTNKVVEENFDAVMICNGHFSTPWLPSLKGMDSFPGLVMHSHSYRDPAPFKDHRSVLVIGAASSGADISVELSAAVESVYLSSTHKPLSSPLPDNVHQVPEVLEVKGDLVCFSNGEECRIESILFCSGYKYHCNFIKGTECGVLVETKRIHPLYKHILNPFLPTMAFIGVNFKILPFHLFDFQVRWVLTVWRGQQMLPSVEEMVDSSERDYEQRLARGIPPQHAHMLKGPMQWEYISDLCTLGKMEPHDPAVESLFEENSKHRTANLMHYRENRYKMISKDEWICLSRPSQC